MRSRHAWWIATLVLIVFAIGFLWPLALVVRNGFIDADGGLTMRYLAGVFRNPIYREGLLNSLRLAAGTTLLSVLLALPPAWILHRYSFFGKRAWSALILVPMILPPFVGAIGFQQILGYYGALNSLLGVQVDWLGSGRWGGVVILQALSLYPVMVLNLSAALSNVDPAMEEAAANLGAAGWTRFRRITLPLITPGLFAGSTIIFIWAFTELGTPLIMNYNRVASVQIYDALKEIGASPFPFALVFVMLTVSVGLYMVGKLIFGRQTYAMQAKTSGLSTETSLSGWRAAAASLPFLVIIMLALMPHVGVILTSVSPPGGWYQSVIPHGFTADNYREALGHAMTVRSIRNSLWFSSLAVVFNLLVGIAIAFVVVRSRLRIRGLIDSLSMMPLAVPGLVMASGYLALSALLSNSEVARLYPGLLHWVDVKTNPTLFLVMAYGIRRLPYMVRSAVAGLQQTGEGFEEAAANLGASPLTVLRRITIPLITANLIAGALLVFAFSMLEVSDSLMLAQRADYFPITKTIYELFQLIGVGTAIASALGVWAMVFLTLTIAGASLLLGKKLGALFRL